MYDVLTSTQEKTEKITKVVESNFSHFSRIQDTEKSILRTILTSQFILVFEIKSNFSLDFLSIYKGIPSIIFQNLCSKIIVHFPVYFLVPMKVH